MNIKPLLLSITLLFALSGCKNEYIPPLPSAIFTYDYITNGPNEVVLKFTDWSVGADRVEWQTSTGTRQTGSTMLVSIVDNTTLAVTLTAYNKAGSDTHTEVIPIKSIATTGSTVFWSQIGNRGDISIYVNGIYQGKLTKYKNDGQAATCGQEGFVTMTLPKGTYPFTAQTNEIFPLKWNGTFSIVNGSCRTQELTK